MKIENSIAHIVHFPFSPGRWMHDNSVYPSGKASIGEGTCFDKQNGFTLIEVIITIVIVAILATMSYTYFGKSITQSGVPVIRLQQAMQLQTVMENITADYKSLYNGTNFNIATLKTRIATSGYYGGPSAIPYTVVDNKYIALNIGATCLINCYTEQNDSTNLNLLKVTVQSNTGETLSLLFSSL